MHRKLDNWIWACPAIAIAVGAAALWLWLWGWSWPRALLIALLLACPGLAIWCAVQLRGAPGPEGGNHDVRKD